MSGPAAAVAAGFYTFYLAKTHADEMVTDDYYKEGKYINMQIERDDEAEKRGISAQVLFNADGSAAKVFASGNFNRAVPLRLSLLHPAKKAYDQTVELNPAPAPASGDKTEYKASLQALPEAVQGQGYYAEVKLPFSHLDKRWTVPLNSGFALSSLNSGGGTHIALSHSGTQPYHELEERLTLNGSTGGGSLYARHQDEVACYDR